MGSIVQEGAQSHAVGNTSHVGVFFRGRPPKMVPFSFFLLHQPQKVRLQKGQTHVELYAEFALATSTRSPVNLEGTHSCKRCTIILTSVSFLATATILPHSVS